jgi:hypothetical protein
MEFAEKKKKMWARFHSWGISRRMETGEDSMSGDGLRVMRNRRHLRNYAVPWLTFSEALHMDRESPNFALSVAPPNIHFRNGCPRAAVQSQDLFQRAAEPDTHGRNRASALIMDAGFSSLANRH